MVLKMNLDPNEYPMRVLHLRKPLSIIGALVLFGLVVVFQHQGLILLREFWTELAVGLTLVGIGILYWGWKPEIIHLVRQGRQPPSPRTEPELEVETENFKQNLADEFEQIVTAQLISDFMRLGEFSVGQVSYSVWKNKSEDTKMKMLGSEFSWFDNFYRGIDQWNYQARRDYNQVRPDSINLVRQARQVYDNVSWVNSRHPELEVRYLQRLERRFGLRR
jgi:hypothetical protein